MKTRVLTMKMLRAYEAWLKGEEKSGSTVEKYLRDVRYFYAFVNGRAVTKELVMAYKQTLIDQDYALRSINSMLAGLNSFLRFQGWEDCRVKALKIQRLIYCAESKELSRAEYLRLLEAAKNRPRLYLLLQTIGGTGIRVSELRYFTVQAVRSGEVEVSAKGKHRIILLPGKLKKLLLRYAKSQGIKSGMIFCTRSGRPLDRSNIWAEMKGLCDAAQIERSKVFPHNLRKLFARTFYSLDRDIAKLADLLGHSSIDTTRIYIVSSGQEHRRKLDQMRLVI